MVDALPYIDQGYDEPGVREAVSVLPVLQSSIWNNFTQINVNKLENEKHFEVSFF